MAAAMIDRLVHHAEALSLKGDNQSPANWPRREFAAACSCDRLDLSVAGDELVECAERVAIGKGGLAPRCARKACARGYSIVVRRIRAGTAWI